MGHRMSPKINDLGGFAFATGMLFKFLKTSTGGIEMGSTVFATASSTAPVDFFYQAPSTGESVAIGSVHVVITDTDIDPAEFGAQSALSNGIQVLVQTSTGGQVLDFLDGQAITRNADWGWLVGSDAAKATVAGVGVDQFVVEWDIADNGGAHLLLEPGQKLTFRVRDDISGVASMRTMIHGEAQS